ncbi:hypothetical protein Misp01_28030 [Microtetraspora sp. NBRC 13810]|uniref:serine/threonine-protein kinase n=1 Tax=Microtetraspora sp. NBRC 13810 TaxID=3030990 RepID=UPI0024A0A82C|nr:serine/threonine protein kinase [Microtetraspora sp. NBRC 13810]GLW07673.1 hypothetical protein Misp01_28030 [Microtetraspora sp. NBRC 13810]
MTDRALGEVPFAPEDSEASRGAAGQGRLVGRRYRLMAPVGRGGMGIVWHAHDVLLDRDVAVKELILPFGLEEADKRAAHGRMIREARSAARLSHPGIVTVHDVVEEDGRPWIVMELVRAWSLEQAVRQSGPLPVLQVAEIGVRVLDALRHAHAAGILHRDVKPGNVLLTADRVVLTDFGLAAIEGDATITQTGLLMGSPAYIPPERIQGHPITYAADLWSFGATIYAAVEGRPPYEGPDAVAVLGAVLTQEPSRPERAGALLPVIDGLLRKDPLDRMNADQTAELLDRVLRSHGSSMARPQAPKPPADPLPIHLMPPLDPPPGPMPSRIIETPSGPVRVPYEPPAGSPDTGSPAPHGTGAKARPIQPLSAPHTPAAPPFDAFGGPSGPQPGFDAFGSLSGSQPGFDAFGGPSGSQPGFDSFGGPSGPQPGFDAFESFGGPSGPQPARLEALDNAPAPPPPGFDAFGGPSGPHRTRDTGYGDAGGTSAAPPGTAARRGTGAGVTRDDRTGTAGDRHPEAGAGSFDRSPGSGRGGAGRNPGAGQGGGRRRAEAGFDGPEWPGADGPGWAEDGSGRAGSGAGERRRGRGGSEARDGAEGSARAARTSEAVKSARTVRMGQAGDSARAVRKKRQGGGGRIGLRLLLAAAGTIGAVVVGLLLLQQGGSDEPPAPVASTLTAPLAQAPNQPATGRAEVPAGYKTRAESGISAAVPEDWGVSTVDSRVTFAGPEDSGEAVTVDKAAPAADGGLAALGKEREASELDEYIQVQLQKVGYGPWKAADWEYTHTLTNGVPMHTLTRYVTVDDKRAYKITFTVPALKWDESTDIRTTFFGTFQPQD